MLLLILRVFIRHTITCSIWDIHHSGTSLNNSLNNASQILIICTTSIFMG